MNAKLRERRGSAFYHQGIDKGRIDIKQDIAIAAMTHVMISVGCGCVETAAKGETSGMRSH
jgi:hypothetical protein